MRHTAELKQPHDDPAAQGLLLGTELADDIVRVADNAQALTLAQLVIQFPEGQIFSPPYYRWPLRQWLSLQLHDALVIAHQILPEVVQVLGSLSTRLLVALCYINMPQEKVIVWLWRPAMAPRCSPVALECFQTFRRGAIGRSCRHTVTRS